jgi:hypothetical protein
MEEKISQVRRNRHDSYVFLPMCPIDHGLRRGVDSLQLKSSLISLHILSGISNRLHFWSLTSAITLVKIIRTIS